MKSAYFEKLNTYMTTRGLLLVHNECQDWSCLSYLPAKGLTRVSPPPVMKTDLEKFPSG